MCVLQKCRIMWYMHWAKWEIYYCIYLMVMVSGRSVRRRGGGGGLAAAWSGCGCECGLPDRKLDKLAAQRKCMKCAT